MKVRTTFTVHIDCELDLCVTKTLEPNFGQIEEERENIEDCIRNAIGYPDPDKIAIRAVWVGRELYFLRSEKNGNE